MYTRKQFGELRISSANKMSLDKKLHKKAIDVLVEADKYNWIHQTTWFGEPILQLPQDMFAIQEIIYKTKPEYIIEVGVAWGGALLFYSSIMEIIGGKRVIGIDKYIPKDLIARLRLYNKISKRIELIKGSSLDSNVKNKIEKIIGRSKRNIIILDSNHTHEHVYNELKIYSEYIGKGFYIICGDTIIEDIPEQKHRPRPWGHGNNPKTAVEQFLRENEHFKIDKIIENKLLFTCNPSGYLFRTK